jgi:hypothetical protein
MLVRARPAAWSFHNAEELQFFIWPLMKVVIAPLMSKSCGRMPCRKSGWIQLAKYGQTSIGNAD